MHFLLDPSVEGAAGGGGEPTPEPTAGLTDELRSELVGAVRDELGLKSGQNLPDMITGATKRMLHDTLGLEKDQNLKQLIAESVAGVQVEQTQIREETPANEAEALRQEFNQVKQIATDLQKEADEARNALSAQRRSAAIGEVLDGFNIRPEMKPLLRKTIEQGIEGPSPLVAEDGTLYVEDDQGMPRPFKDAMGEYLNANTWALASTVKTGSGARGRQGAQTPAQLDVKKYATDRDYIAEVSSESPDSSESRLDAVREHNRARFKELGIDY